MVKVDLFLALFITILLIKKFKSYSNSNKISTFLGVLLTVFLCCLLLFRIDNLKGKTL